MRAAGAARIRPATGADLDAMLRVKRGLAIPRESHGVARGGFLLGSSLAQYAALVEHACVRVLETAEGEVAGFGIGLPDALLRRSDLWTRAGAIEWSDDVRGRVEGEPAAYFDQLAVEPRARYFAPALAYAVFAALHAAGHRHLFATVVAEPVRNRASLPVLHAAGARRVGSVRETYDGVGSVRSDVYYADMEAAAATLAAAARGRRVRRMAAGDATRSVRPPGG